MLLSILKTDTQVEFCSLGEYALSLSIFKSVNQFYPSMEPASKTPSLKQITALVACFRWHSLVAAWLGISWAPYVPEQLLSQLFIPLFCESELEDVCHSHDSQGTPVISGLVTDACAYTSKSSFKGILGGSQYEARYLDSIIKFLYKILWQSFMPSINIIP